MLLLEEYKKILSALEIGEEEVKGNFREILQSKFHEGHPTITERNNDLVNSDEAWLMFRRKPKDISYALTYPLLVNKYRA